MQVQATAGCGFLHHITLIVLEKHCAPQQYCACFPMRLSTRMPPPPHTSTPAPSFHTNTPACRELQWEALLCWGPYDAAAHAGTSAAYGGVRVHWHRGLDAVPQDDGVPALYIAQEFFDALPVHQFQRTGGCLCARACVRHATHGEKRSTQSPSPAPTSHPHTPSHTLADRGWGERLVDIASPDSPLHLRLVLSPSSTAGGRSWGTGACGVGGVIVSR
jgi:hypothetical protein